MLASLSVFYSAVYVIYITLHDA